VARLTAEEIIARLRLEPLPGEGGWFVETYRGPPSAPGSAASVATAIYYLLDAASYSALHVLPNDEVYHFYLGDPVDLHTLTDDGTLTVVRLGSDLAGGERPQAVVPAGVWQGSRLAPGGRWALLGTTVHPGFEFADLRLADPALLHRFPRHRSILDGLLARPSWRFAIKEASNRELP
jgi:predicted cupin superfamily sugar epimerase